MDVSVMSVYSKGIAPEPGSCTPEFYGDSAGPEFFLLKGKSPRESISPTAICRAGPATPYVNFLH